MKKKKQGWKKVFKSKSGETSHSLVLKGDTTEDEELEVVQPTKDRSLDYVKEYASKKSPLKNAEPHDGNGDDEETLQMDIQFADDWYVFKFFSISVCNPHYFVVAS